MTFRQQPSGARLDSLRAALDSAFADPAYRWERRDDPFGVIRRALDGVFERLDALRSAYPDAFRVVSWLAIAALAIVLARAVWVAVRTIRSGSGRSLAGATPLVSVPRDAAWYAAETARLLNAGRFADAIQTDFVRFVLELDARRLARFHPSKTPGEYTRDASLPDEGRRELRQLVAALYAYAFARVPCGRAEFDDWHARAQVGRWVTGDGSRGETYAPAH